MSCCSGLVGDMVMPPRPALAVATPSVGAPRAPKKRGSAVRGSLPISCQFLPRGVDRHSMCFSLEKVPVESAGRLQCRSTAGRLPVDSWWRASDVLLDGEPKAAFAVRAGSVFSLGMKVFQRFSDRPFGVAGGVAELGRGDARIGVEQLADMLGR